MFHQDFSFNPRYGAHSLEHTTEQLTRQPTRSLSPCSGEASTLPSRYTMTDLAACFATSRLRPEAQICYESCEAYANPDDDAGWQLDPISCDNKSPSTTTASSQQSPVSAALRAIPRPYHPSSTRRVQRQLQSRLLASSRTHQKDIATLMARMVDTREQCRVEPPNPSPTTIIPSTESPDTYLAYPTPPRPHTTPTDHPTPDLAFDLDIPLADDDDEGYDSSAVSTDAFSPASSVAPTSPGAYSSISSLSSSASTTSLPQLHPCPSSHQSSSWCIASKARLQYRRSADVLSTTSAACVRKPVRTRKARKERRREKGS